MTRYPLNLPVYDLAIEQGYFPPKTDFQQNAAAKQISKNLIKENPLDSEGRIIKPLYTNLDLTETGHKILDELYDKWLAYTDKNDADSLKRARNVKQLEKYYQKLTED